jgi:hypothetical protein
MTTSLVRPFAVISGAQVHRARDGREKQLVELVEATYRLHAAGETVNPASYFLRFPDRPASRIITRPASLGGTSNPHVQRPGDPGPALGDEPAQGRGLGLVGCQAKGTERNPPK